MAKQGKYPLFDALNKRELRPQEIERANTDRDTTHGNTWLHIAAKADITEVRGQENAALKLNSVCPALRDVRNKKGLLPIHVAAHSGLINLLEALLAEKDPTSPELRVQSKTVLHIAAYAGNVDSVKYLLKKHPELVLASDDKGRTAIDYAVKAGKSEMIEPLLLAIPDLAEWDKNNKETASAICKIFIKDSYIKDLIEEQAAQKVEAQRQDLAMKTLEQLLIPNPIQGIIKGYCSHKESIAQAKAPAEFSHSAQQITRRKSQEALVHSV
jgi:ankyrin repeat protein